VETKPPLAPHQLLDDGFAPEACDVVVIGCGNILRGDDAVGPTLIRELHQRGLPDGVRLVDGGTAGMDVAFAMRGAGRVVIVDAANTGNPPGTLYRVPAEELAQLPPIDGLHTHNFRWDHALSFSSWLLGPERTDDVTVFLVEAGSMAVGEPLSEPVAAAMRDLADVIVRDHYPRTTGHTVELTVDGYLHLSAEQAGAWFPADLCVARLEENDLVLMPVRGAANGGLVLKQRTPDGDRSLLIHELLGFRAASGEFPVTWDAAAGQLRVHLEPAREGSPDGRAAASGGRSTAGPRAVDSLGGHDLDDRRGASPAEHPPHPGAGAVGGRRAAPDVGEAEALAGGSG
jgi:hydrogenase maturation protease